MFIQVFHTYYKRIYTVIISYFFSFFLIFFLASQDDWLLQKSGGFLLFYLANIGFCAIYSLLGLSFARRVENRRTALSVLPIPATSNRAYDFPVHGFPVNFFLNHISLNRFNFRSYSTLFCNRYIILIYHITNCYSISSSHIPSFPFVSSKIFLSSSLHNLLYMRSICLNFLF